LHLDVDAISSDEFRATNYAGPEGGLSLPDVQRAMAIFVGRPNMIALEVSTYNPALDPDGSAAKVLVELLVGVLTVRLAALESPAELAKEADQSAAPPVQSEAASITSFAEPTAAEHEVSADTESSAPPEFSEHSEPSDS